MAKGTRLVTETIDAALGRSRRDDPLLPRTGGPRGNAHLTAWTGLTLFVLFAAEGITLLSIGGLITWHIAIGALLVPPTLLKTASTGWRILGYYAQRGPYLSAGPPPLVLRVLGPLVIVSSIAVLATGIVLIVVGQDASRSTSLTIGGLSLDLVFLHKAVFFLWFAVMAVHVIARLIPALLIARSDLRTPRAVPGLGGRAAVLLASAVAGVALALLLVHVSGSWSASGGGADAAGSVVRR